MRAAILSGLAAGLLTVSAVPVRAQEPAKEPLADQVRVALDRGVRFLKQQEAGRGNWESSATMEALNMRGGYTCLALLALLNAGVPPDDDVIVRGLNYLRTKVPPQTTYVVGLETMVYAEAGYAEDKVRIQTNVDWLLRARIHGGRGGAGLRGWSYGAGGEGRGGDNSNTQYALLGLWAGKTAGARIEPAVWQSIRDYYLLTQQDAGDGGWYYDPARKTTTLTMTTAGLCGLLIAGQELNKGQQGLNEQTGVAARCGHYVDDKAVQAALRWIGSPQHFTLTPRGHQFYNIYGIERAGRLSGQRFFGSYDWYREGCKLLVQPAGPGAPWGQHEDGSWSVAQQVTDGWPVVSTSFALLFLSKGRTPILISKLAHGEPNSTDWNRKRYDCRHLVDYASRELFHKMPLGWQVYDPRRLGGLTDAQIREEVSELLPSPVVYITGHDRPTLTDTQKKILKRYLEEGGFLFAEACCGDRRFVEGFKDLMEDPLLFKDNPLQPVPPDHAVWTAHAAVRPEEFPGLQCIRQGCKTVVIFSPQPLAGFFEEDQWSKQAHPSSKGPAAFRLAGNVIAYATGLEPPRPKLTKVEVLDEQANDLRTPRGYLKVGQLRHDGDWQPAPRAMRNLLMSLGQRDRLDVDLKEQEVNPSSPEVFQFKFLYMHGRGDFQYGPTALENLRADLKLGGVLLADACCGSKAFDTAFRAFAQKLYPGQRLERIPPDDPLLGAELNGTAITTVRCRRERADGQGAEPEYQTVAPLLEGVKVDDRWVVIYSRYDIGCALEKHPSSDCLGHDHESALRLGRAAVLYMLRH
jgi:hypothetical protein